MKQPTATDDKPSSRPEPLRQEIPSDGALCRGPVYLNLECFAAYVYGQAVALTRLEFDILAYLMRHVRRVVSHEELVKQVFHGVYRADSSLIRVHLTHLRRKLGPGAGAIETVRGRGIHFNEHFMAGKQNDMAGKQNDVR
jgi:DNA-binding response OmpR family regulator